MKAILAAALLAMLLPSAAGAAADANTTEARARFKRGAELYRQARYKEAIVEFEAAYKAKPHGVLHYNIAQCHEKLGDIPSALRSYHEYLREVPNAEDKDSVLKAMSNLEARLAAGGVQQLLVYSEPSGAEVWIDGQSRGRTPFSTVLPHGTHAVSLVKDGYETITRETVMAPDRSVELSLTMQMGKSTVPVPLPPAPPGTSPQAGAAAPAGASPSLAGRGPVPSIPLAPPPAPPAVKKGKLWTWVALGVGAAAVGAGAYFGSQAKSKSNELTGSQHEGPVAQKLYDDAQSKARTANILYGVAGAAGAVGVTLFFIEGTF